MDMDNIYYDGDFVRNRIKQLLSNQNVSEREISISIGKNMSYITHVVSGDHLPSIDTFFAICEYFKITPIEFFDAELKDPNAAKRINMELQRLLQTDYSELARVLESLTLGDIKVIKECYSIFKRIIR